MHEPASSASVLIVEDESALRQSLEALANSAGYRWHSYGCAEALLADELPGPPCCVWADLHLPGMSGLALQRQLVAQARALPLVMMSADTRDANARRALEAGVLAFLPKPVDPELLLHHTEAALQKDRRARPL